jgi:hypothetical protein
MLPPPANASKRIAAVFVINLLVEQIYGHDFLDEEVRAHDLLVVGYCLFYSFRGSAW